MSYQRWDKPGRWYVWASHDALHIWQTQEIKISFKHNAEGRDNARAVFRGLLDFLGDKEIKKLLKESK